MTCAAISTAAGAGSWFSGGADRGDAVEPVPRVLDGVYELPSSSATVALGPDVAVAVVGPDGTARVGREEVE